MSQPMQIKILGAEDQVVELRDFFASHPDSVTIQRYGKEPTQTSLGFGLAEVKALVALIKVSFEALSLSKKIYELLVKKPGSKIVISTPQRSVEFRSDTKLSKEEVDEILSGLVKAIQ